jgi:hypothetical protein
MKMYKVFECEGYTFKWAGGCTIKVYWEGIEGDNKVDTIDFYQTYTDKEVSIECLNWLEENDIIEDQEAYII